MRSALLMLCLVVLASACAEEDPSNGDDTGFEAVDLGQRDASVSAGEDAGTSVSDMAIVEVDAGLNEDMAATADMAADMVVAPDMAPEPTWDCRAVPNSACGGASPTTNEHFIQDADGCAFKLVPWSASRVAERSALIDALGQKSDGVVGVDQLLGALNRVAVDGIGAKNADRLKNHNFRGFRWNSGDASVDYWWPQGITGTSDAKPDSRWNGRKAVMVSWYNKTEDALQKGVRIALADTTNIDDVTYRLLLLVEPSGTAANPSFGPVLTGGGTSLHAGGIVWWENYLFVADTGGGIRVFDLSRTMKVKNTDNKSAIGVSGSRFEGFGYGYVVPELARFRRTSDSCPIKFSFLGLDRSSQPPALVSGEYEATSVLGRIAMWDMDPATNLPEVRTGESRATDAFVTGQNKMQGATRYNGNIYISSSSQYNTFGRLYRTKPGYGESAITAWVYGAEDLYVDRSDDTIWTAAEYPGDRDVVGIPLLPPP